MEPDGYKRIISGGDPFNNCTEVDKIKILDQCMYLICALSNALTNYPMTTWRQCCEDASKTCSIITKSYTGTTIEEWWVIFCENNCFPHPHGNENNTNKYKSRLPPFLCDNEDLHKKIIKYCMQNLSDLTIEHAKQFIIDKLYPLAVPHTEDNWQEQSEILWQL